MILGKFIRPFKDCVSNKLIFIYWLFLFKALYFSVPALGYAESSLNVQMAQPSASVTLSAEGTSDWAHWGLTAATSFNHKSGVTPQISNYTLLGSTRPSRFADSRVGYSWSGGTPTASATDSITGICFTGIGNGYRLTIPAQRGAARV